MIAGVRAYSIGSGMAWREQHFDTAVKCVSATDPTDALWKRRNDAVSKCDTDQDGTITQAEAALFSKWPND